jgi:lactoylglutathione lyase
MIPPLGAINHVALHVADVEVSVRFYRDVLGLEPLPRPAFTFPGAWFRLGTVQELHLLGERSDLVYSHSRGTHFALNTTDIDGWETYLTEKNIQFRPPKPRPDGLRQLFVVDPDGYWIELVEGLCSP